MLCCKLHGGKSNLSALWCLKMHSKQCGKEASCLWIPHINFNVFIDTEGLKSLEIYLWQPIPWEGVMGSSSSTNKLFRCRHSMFSWIRCRITAYFFLLSKIFPHYNQCISGMTACIVGVIYIEVLQYFYQGNTGHGFFSPSVVLCE